jgi:hypothetical protein
VREERQGDTLTLYVLESAIFTNYLGLKKRLVNLDSGVRRVVLDFEKTWVVDHTVLEKLHKMELTWDGRREMILAGLDGHAAMSSHELAARRKPRMVIA